MPFWYLLVKFKTAFGVYIMHQIHQTVHIFARLRLGRLDCASIQNRLDSGFAVLVYANSHHFMMFLGIFVAACTTR